MVTSSGPVSESGTVAYYLSFALCIACEGETGRNATLAGARGSRVVPMILTQRLQMIISLFPRLEIDILFFGA